MYSPHLITGVKSMSLPSTFAIHLAALFLGASLIACGGGNKQDSQPKPVKKDDPNAKFGPLEIGSDWNSYTKLNTEPVKSDDHGGRWVDTYVNDVGVEAYKAEDAEIPVGTIVVKTSVQNDGGKPGTKAGPIFVMKKMEAGFDEPNGDWYYAIHWEEPTAKLKAKYGQMYWRSPSPKVKYCWECHNDYDRQLGQVPEEQRVQ